MGRGLFEGTFEKDAGFCGGLFEKGPPHPPKTPQQKGLLPMEGRANNVLPFFVLSRGSFRSAFVRYRF